VGRNTHVRFSFGVNDAPDSAILAVHAVRISRRILRTVIAIVPIKDIETAIRPHLQRDRHEPGIIGRQQIRLAFSQVSRPVTPESVYVDAAAVNIAHADALAVCGGKSVGVEVDDPAIRGLLMTVIRDRADLHGERRIGPGLAVVVAALDEMEQVVVGPVTGFNDGAAFRIPGDTVRIAGALREDLKLPRARVKPPHRAVKVVSLAILIHNPTLIEHPIEPIQPAIRPPGQRIRQFVRVRAAKAGKDNFAAGLFALIGGNSRIQTLKKEIEKKASEARSRWQNLQSNWTSYTSAKDFATGCLGAFTGALVGVQLAPNRITWSTRF